MAAQFQDFRRGDKTLLIVPHEQRATAGHVAWRVEEAESLSRGIGLDLVPSYVYPIRRVRPETYITKGHLDECLLRVEAEEVALVIFDGQLSPIQQRNLEKYLNTKVIDRTGLILEIFGERARTAEGSLQVELAALTYQRSRLVRSWTHLERQRGGLGFIGGPGESQIELDRRLIDQKITKIKAKLEKVKKTRTLHRKNRQEVPFPVVSLVGYTNAGKSTLFNTLTKAKVFAKDMPFATLDPTMRQVSLESGLQAILSDTVGFISELPTQLIAAFRATLEEVLEADLLVHVIDYSHPQWQEMEQEVLHTLKEMDVIPGETHPMITFYNKIDACTDSSHPKPKTHEAYISALDSADMTQVREMIRTFLLKQYETIELTLTSQEHNVLSELHRYGVVQDVREEGGKLHIKARLLAKDVSRFIQRDLLEE